MATSWILGKVSDALQPTVQGVCSTAGSFAGGAMNTVGSSINGVGDSINSNIRHYGDGAKDYGNAIMDWSSAPATRAQTASNPLGLSGSAAGGKAGATSPTVYRAAPAPKKKVPETKPVQKKIVSAPKSSASSGVIQSRPKPKIEPTKKVSPLKASTAPTAKTPVTPKAIAAPKTMVSKPNTGAVKSTVPVKSVPVSAAKGKPAAKNNPAKNPLGLSF